MRREIYMDTYYEIREQTYDTFGEHETYISRRFKNKDAAEAYVSYVNRMWGSRAEMYTVSEPDVEDTTAAQIHEQFKWLR